MCSHSLRVDRHRQRQRYFHSECDPAWGNVCYIETSSPTEKSEISMYIRGVKKFLPREYAFRSEPSYQWEYLYSDGHTSEPSSQLDD